MSKTVTFVGKHSKDKVVSVYLNKRVFVDEGDGIEPITGVVKVEPSRIASLPSDMALFVKLVGRFVWESFDLDMDIVDCKVYEKVVQLYPKVPEAVLKTRLQLPDEHHYPFEFKLPTGLPPSISLNPGFVYYGTSLGISYEVSTYIGFLPKEPDLQYVEKSKASLLIRKASYFPRLRDIRPTQTGEKVYLGGHKPLVLTATLDHEIYYPGQPILVSIHVRNDSSHDVYRIRISAKQVVMAKLHTGQVEEYKCQVALLESTRGCPIKKHDEFNQNFSITPQLLGAEGDHVAQVGKLNVTEEGRLAPTTRPEEAEREKKGLVIEYYLNVHCEVVMAKDLIVKIPFTISGGEKKEDTKPHDKESHGLEEELLINQLVSRGYSRNLVTETLEKHSYNFEKAFDWLQANHQPTDKPSTQNTGMVQFEDEATPGQSQEQGIPGVPFQADITKAGELLLALRQENVSTQAALAQGKLTPTPTQQNEINTMMSEIVTCGTKLQEFLADVVSHDENSTYSSAQALVSHLKTLNTIVTSIANHSNPQLQQNLVNLMHDLLEHAFFLLATARDFTAYFYPENRRKLMNLADLTTESLAALRAALPGLKEIDMAVGTINSAINELSYQLPVGFETEKLQTALDTLNSTASQLSQVFQRLGTASTGPTEELASVAQQYRNLLPVILSNGKTILGAMLNDQARNAFLKLLQEAGATNVQLLLASKEINASPNSPILKNQLDSRARDVVEAMKQLLVASNELQTQLKSKQASTPPASSNVANIPKMTNSAVPNVPPANKQVSTPPAVNVAPSSSSNPTSNKKIAKLGELERRDSFDEFVFHRVGANPAPAPSVEQKDSVANQLEQCLAAIDQSQKSILAARAKPQTTATHPQPAPPTFSAILDAVLLVVQISAKLALTIQERYKELLIMEKNFGQQFNVQLLGSENLANTSKKFADSIAELSNKAIAVAFRIEDITQLVLAASAVNSTSAQILEISKNASSVPSSTEQLLDSTSRDLFQKIAGFISVVSMQTGNQQQPVASPPASNNPFLSPAQNAGTNPFLSSNANVGGLDHQMRALRLEKDLQIEKTKQYAINNRKPSRGGDSD